MIDTPQIVQTTDQHTAVIHLTIPRADIQKEMGPAIAELMEVVSAQGIGPAGPWLSHHLKMSPDIFDFEVAVPVLAPVTPTGRVTRGRLPATRAMRTTYAGGYEGLGNAWGELQAWVAAEGHTTGTDLWEVYRVGPESSQNPADWRTDLYQPLR
jgi:effector-binding domain-containing protein